MHKIAITGPESSGKSWLASKLAQHYNTVFVPEYARDYLQGLGRSYNADDLLQIAYGQFAAQQQAISGDQALVFFDTDFLVLKIWCQHRYQSCPAFILEQLQTKQFDLHLLCNIDLPWEYDPQREHPHLRGYFLDWYQRELEAYNFPYRVISGQGEQRLQAAINSINEYFGI